MNSKDVEAINYGLAERLGADKCHSIDHLARLPYTRNSKTGLVGPVIRSEPGYVKVERLPSVQPPAAGDTDIDIGDLREFQPVASVEEFHQLVRSLDCPEVKKDDLILSALHPEAANALRVEKLDTSDRSAVMFSWAIKAAMAGMCPSDIRDCILSPALGAISAHLLDPAKVSPTGASARPSGMSGIPWPRPRSIWRQQASPRLGLSRTAGARRGRRARQPRARAIGPAGEAVVGRQPPHERSSDDDHRPRRRGQVAPGDPAGDDGRLQSGVRLVAAAARGGTSWSSTPRTTSMSNAAACSARAM